MNAMEAAYMREDARASCTGERMDPRYLDLGLVKLDGATADRALRAGARPVNGSGYMVANYQGELSSITIRF